VVNQLRIVLFGRPGAGKTSLLGALGQAARIQETLLNGKLIDASHRLENLRQTLTEKGAGPSAAATTDYPIELKPESGRAISAVLVDSDGRAADDLMALPHLTDETPGALADAVVHADALIVAVDVTAPAEKLEADLQEVGRFLYRLQQHRDNGVEVSGMPVFLVLTKCDRLGKQGASLVQWMEDIEVQKGKAHDVLRTLIEQAPAAFGRVDVHVWATAIERPRGPEPYGVAELFRVCLEQANRYRAQRRQSNRWLIATAAGAGSALVALLILVGVFVVNRPHPLQNRVPPPEPNAAVRLAGSAEQLRARLRELRSLESDPDFATLKPMERERITDRANELEEYLQLYDQVEALFAPGQVHSLAEAEEIQIAPERRDEWRDTVLANDLDALHSVRSNIDPSSPLGWYNLQALGLKHAPRTTNLADWAEWRRSAQDLLARKPPDDDTPLDESRITWGMVSQLREVRALKERWDKEQSQGLKRLLAISAALGLDPDKRDQPLDIKPPVGDAAFKEADWTARLNRLKSDYGAELSLVGLSDADTEGIRAAAGERYAAALAYGRAAVAARLREIKADGDESLETWQKLRDWLVGKNDLGSWRTLANILVHLYKPDAADPVRALADFLSDRSVIFEVKSLIVEMPHNSDLTPKKELAIYYPTPDKRVAVFRRTDDGKLDDSGRYWRYVFEAEQTQTIVYQLGEYLAARLPMVNTDGNTAELTWAAGKGQSKVFQYESLLGPPRIKSEPVAEVSLKIGEGRLPPVPDLFPRKVGK
jgi:hypothetical protein